MSGSRFRGGPAAIGLAVGALGLGLTGCGSAATSAVSTRTPPPVAAASTAPAQNQAAYSAPPSLAAGQGAAPNPSGPSAAASAVANAAGNASSASAGSSEQPVAPEQNPPGDIPDTQAFVTYTSPTGGYKLDVPEGWARTTNGANVTFKDKIDGLKVDESSAGAPPTTAEVQQSIVPRIERAGRAVKTAGVQQVQLRAGAAVLLKYTSNSDPNPVTGKQVRLEDNTYVFYKKGKEALLTLWAPQGADNVDQWQRIASSFTWTA